MILAAVTWVKVPFYFGALDLFSSSHLSGNPHQVQTAFTLKKFPLNIGHLALGFSLYPFASKPCFPFSDVTVIDLLQELSSCDFFNVCVARGC